MATSLPAPTSKPEDGSICQFGLRVRGEAGKINRQRLILRDDSALRGLADRGDALLDVPGCDEGGFLALHAALETLITLVTGSLLAAFGAMAHEK